MANPLKLFRLSRVWKDKLEKYHSLTFTLTFAFLGLSAVVLLVTSILNMYNNYRNNQTLIADQQHLIAKEAAATVKDFLNEKFTILAVATKVGNLAFSTQPEQRTILQKLIGYQPAFRQLLLFAPDGEELFRVARASNLTLNQLTQRDKRHHF